MKVAASRAQTTVGTLMLVAALAYLVHFVPRGWIPHDEGMLAQSAERVLRGDIPHIDYQEPYTGGMSWLYAAVFKISGVDLLHLRWLLFAGALLATCLLYSILRRYLRPIGAALATWVSLAWSFPNWFTALPSWWLLICALVCVWAVIRFVETGRFHLRCCRWSFDWNRDDLQANWSVPSRRSGPVLVVRAYAARRRAQPEDLAARSVDHGCCGDCLRCDYSLASPIRCRRSLSILSSRRVCCPAFYAVPKQTSSFSNERSSQAGNRCGGGSRCAARVFNRAVHRSPSPRGLRGRSHTPPPHATSLCQLANATCRSHDHRYSNARVGAAVTSIRGRISVETSGVTGVGGCHCAPDLIPVELYCVPVHLAVHACLRCHVTDGYLLAAGTRPHSR